MLIRYRVSHTKDFSVGFSLEKDAGEPLVWNPQQRASLGPITCRRTCSFRSGAS